MWLDVIHNNTYQGFIAADLGLFQNMFQKNE
jgi:hypothetical protein